MFSQVHKKMQVFIRFELNGSLDVVVQTIKLMFSAQKQNRTDN